MEEELAEPELEPDCVPQLEPEPAPEPNPDPGVRDEVEAELAVHGGPDGVRWGEPELSSLLGACGTGSRRKTSSLSLTRTLAVTLTRRVGHRFASRDLFEVARRAGESDELREGGEPVALNLTQSYPKTIPLTHP